MTILRRLGVMEPHLEAMAKIVAERDDLRRKAFVAVMALFDVLDRSSTRPSRLYRVAYEHRTNRSRSSGRPRLVTHYVAELLSPVDEPVESAI